MSEQSTSDPQTGMDRFFDMLRGVSVRRRSDDKWIAGVCSGLADRLGIDPVIIRAGFVLLSLLGGAGLTLYLLAWALIPNDQDEIVARRALRDGDGGSITVLILAAIGLFGGSAFGGPWWGNHPGWGFPWSALLTGLFIWWLLTRSSNRPGAGQRVSAQQLGTPSAGTSAAGSPAQSTTGSGAAHAQGPPQTQVLPQSEVRPQSQPPPKRPSRRSGGPLMALLAIGLAVTTYGSLLWAGNAFSWAGDHRTIALAGALGAIGLLSVVLGVAGWRAGFVALLAAVLALTAWTSAIMPSGIHLNGQVGDATWAPTSLAPGTNYQLGVGDGVLDLSKVPAPGISSATSPTTIPVNVGMGDLTVLVSSGLNVRVEGHVSLGAIRLPDDAGSNGLGGSDINRTADLSNGPAEVVVKAGVGIGQLTVVKE